MRHKPIKAATRVKHPAVEPPPARPRVLRLINVYYVSHRTAEKPLGFYVSGFSSFWSP